MIHPIMAEYLIRAKQEQFVREAEERRRAGAMRSRTDMSRRVRRWALLAAVLGVVRRIVGRDQPIPWHRRPVRHGSIG